MPSVAVVGGSLGGLTAALLLRDIGCDVTVFERSRATLQARGAGIAVLPETVRYPVERLGLPVEQITSSTEWIRFLDRDGSVGHEQRHRYRFSSWNTIYGTLLDAFGTEHYRLSRDMTSFADEVGGVSVRFADGDEVHADLLVCADGIGSHARSTLLPDVAPRYAGYVAWRGTVPERELDGATFEALHDALTYQVLPGSHILAYPIPGPDGAIDVGDRLINMVWYRNVAEPDLAAFLTDRDGQPRSVSLPPGSVRDELVDELRLRRRARGTADRGDRRPHPGAVRPGGVRHRGAAHGVRPGLPARRRRLRCPPARRGRNGEGGGGRLGPRHGARGRGRGRAQSARRLGGLAARARLAAARAQPGDRRQLAVRRHLPAR
ncbi:FAD binding domain-containing protein [Pseudonocardia sp. T1-2H]|uniref:FAD binding domain-containing protein n=1 Tax=Pseudonocardia sp. T1-2H TaxID=3128899 RepID=UPI003100BEFC